MNNKITNIAGGLLGLAFLVFGLNFFLHFIKIPSPPEGSAAAAFMGAMYGSGDLTFVKVLEIIGGLLVAVPKTRNIGLLVLGPIVINILAFHAFVVKGGLFEPAVVVITLLTVFLLWSGRKAFANLLSE